tara:strand:- start:399 stop:878 length:480 start_codon:yes stop_codon:yes gene_type:complete
MSYFKNILDSIKNTLSFKKLLISSCMLIFIIISIVIYNKYVKTKLNKTYVDNREFLPKDYDDSDKSATLYFFYTNWCPLSKKAEPEWHAFKENTNGSLDGIFIIFKEIDCDKDPETADKFNITGYPTIKLVYKNVTYEYDAKPDRVTLNKFLTDIFNNP